MSRAYSGRRAAAALLCGVGALLGGRIVASQSAVCASPPTGDAIFTSTREVTGLAVTLDGELWAGTTGGVLRRLRSGSWRKYTRLDGLPSHEVRKITAYDNSVVAEFPMDRATWDGDRWSAEPLPADARLLTRPPLIETQWKGSSVTASLDEIAVRTGERMQHVALPPSGTHASALMAKGDRLLVAAFGDGIWEYGTPWKRLEIGLPGEAREITAMAECGGELWLGTRRDGLWSWDGRDWRQHLQPNEPYNHDVQSIVNFGGETFISSLEDGLSVRTADKWRHIAPAVISSRAPRQMVEFKGALYLRHGNGKVDRFDPAGWQKNVFPALPHKDVSAIAADDSRLYAAQWGGWSEWDGGSWTHHLDAAELQGVPTTALLPDSAGLWIGTQGKGLFRWNRVTGNLERHDERLGLPDDWITCLAESGGAVYAGTFVGGLAWLDGGRWHIVPEMEGQNVTDLIPDPGGGLYAATRTGLWRCAGPGKLFRIGRPFVDEEIQSLCRDSSGLWVGARTGLFFLKTP